MNGVPVIAPEDLAEFVSRYQVERILLAVPSASRRRKAEILRRLESLNVHVQSVPGIQRRRDGSRTRRRAARNRRRRPARPRSGPAEPGTARRLDPRQVGDGLGRGRLDRLRAVPADRAAGAEAARAVREFRDRALQHRARAPGDHREPQARRADLRAARQCAPQVPRARRDAVVSACRPSITQRRTSTCRSSSRTSSKASTTTSSAPGTRRRPRSKSASRPSC